MIKQLDFGAATRLSDAVRQAKKKNPRDARIDRYRCRNRDAGLVDQRVLIPADKRDELMELGREWRLEHKERLPDDDHLDVVISPK